MPHSIIQLDDELAINVIGDLEGEWEFLARSVETIADLSEGWVDTKREIIVFMGDITDKSCADQRVLNTVVSTLKMNPLAFALIGNRDLTFLKLYRLNKKNIIEDMRFELSYPEEERCKVGEKREENLEWVAIFGEAFSQHFKSLTHCQDEEIISHMQTMPEESLCILKLKWILPNAMGAPDAFENCREELKNNQKPHDDAAVKGVFMENIYHQGNKVEYLRHANLALILNQTIFVHAAINKKSIFVPDDLGACDTLQDFVMRINALKNKLVQGLERCNAEGKNPTEDVACAPLIKVFSRMANAYVRHHGYSVVSDFPRDIDSKDFIRRCPTDKDLLKIFRDSGIHSLVVGHQPTGVDYQLVLRATLDEHFTFNIISCDTYYSHKNNSYVKTRLQYRGERCHVSLWAKRQSGKELLRQFVLTPMGAFYEASREEDRVGEMLDSAPGWSIQGYDAVNQEYLLHFCETCRPFTCHTCVVPKDSLSSFDPKLRRAR
jgi:hypothetical protein